MPCGNHLNSDAGALFHDREDFAVCTDCKVFTIMGIASPTLVMGRAAG
jgi:hypothetical protein